MTEEVPPEAAKKTVMHGAILGAIVIACCQAPAFFVGAVWLAAFGITQLIGIVPLAIFLGWQTRWPEFRGVLIVAGIAFLLNSLCTVLVMTQFKLH